MATNITPLITHGNVIIGGLGTPGTMTTSNGVTWTASNTAKMTAKGQMHLEGPNADLIINEQSLSDWMQAVNKRLSILQPKPELHEKYTALEEAYNHYKTLEALLYDDQKSNK